MYYSFCIIKAFEKKVFRVKRNAYNHSGLNIFKLVKTGTFRFLSFLGYLIIL